MSRDSAKKQRRRKNRVAKGRKNSQVRQWCRARQEKVLRMILDSYRGGSSRAPSPTLVDAISHENINNNKTIEKAFLECIASLNNRIEEVGKQDDVVGFELSDIVFSFLVPLDFYIPINEPHYVGDFAVEDGLVFSLCDTLIFSCLFPVGCEAGVKVSLLLISFCLSSKVCVSRISELGKSIDSLYDKAIIEANKIISAYQAIPTRHNHYMHKVTKRMLPGHIFTILSCRENGEILDSGYCEFHQNVEGEIFQARPLSKTELSQFEIAHINKSFTKDRVFSLVSKFNDAVNLRCMGIYDSKLVLLDTVCQLAVGYIYCEMMVYDGNCRDDVIRQYVQIDKMSDLWSRIGVLVGMSTTRLKKDVEFSKWYKYCREVRNDLAHRFIYREITDRDSGNAIYYTGLLVRTLCHICMNKCDEESPCYDKLCLLASSTIMADTMLREYHD